MLSMCQRALAVKGWTDEMLIVSTDDDEFLALSRHSLLRLSVWSSVGVQPRFGKMGCAKSPGHVWQ